MELEFKRDGFAIHRQVISLADIAILQREADCLASSVRSACVRHIRERSRCFDSLSVSENLLGLLPCGYRPVRSILFDKTESENWPVAWHQDLTITVAEQKPVRGYGPWSQKDGSWHVQPPVEVLEKIITLRLHLDPTPSENGALRVIPGSHKHGKVSAGNLSGAEKSSAVVCECGVGDVVMMVPLLQHASSRSVNPARRRVLHFEYAIEEELDSALEWFELASY